MNNDTFDKRNNASDVPDPRGSGWRPASSEGRSSPEPSPSISSTHIPPSHADAQEQINYSAQLQPIGGRSGRSLFSVFLIVVLVVSGAATAYFREAFLHHSSGQWFEYNIAGFVFLGTSILLFLRRIFGGRGRGSFSPPVPNPGSGLRGEVHGFQQRTERATNNVERTVWTFRLERFHDGTRLAPIPVEMRGGGFSGFINEGDTVQLYENWREGQVVRAKRVFNVTNNIQVVAKGPKTWMVILAILAFITFAAFAVFFNSPV